MYFRAYSVRKCWRLKVKLSLQTTYPDGNTAFFNDISHKTFTCSPQENIIVEFIKMTRSKVYTRLILNTVLLPDWATAVFLCLVIVVHESLVCPEQLNCLLFFRKILQLPQFLGVSSIFLCIWTLMFYSFIVTCIVTYGSIGVLILQSTCMLYPS